MAWETNEWGCRIPVGNCEEVILHSPTAIIHSGVSITLLNNSEETQNYQHLDQTTNVVKLLI